MDNMPFSQRPRRPLPNSESLDRALTGRSSPSSSPPAAKRGRSGVHVLISSLLILQVVAGLVVFSILSPSKSTPALPTTPEESEVSFTVPTEVEAQPVLPEQFAKEIDLGLPEIEPPPVQPVSLGDLLAETAAAVTTNSESLVIRGLEITQGIQVFNEPENSRCNPKISHSDHIFCNNSMPLVTGRHTLLRLYLACNGACPGADTAVTLRVLKDGEAREVLTRHLAVADLAQVSGLSMPELRLDLGRSVNFEFLPPPEWMNGQIGFEIEATAGTGPVATLSTSHSFAVRKPLRVAYVPIQYQGVTPTNLDNIDHWLLRLYPVPAVEYYRLPVPDLVWDKELSKAEILQELLYVYWLYAEQQPAEALPDQLFGWLPQEYYNGGASDPDWCPNCAGPHSSRVAFGGMRPEQDIGAPRILVHEVAHNLGAKHAWSPTQQEDSQCFRAEGADIRVDPAWPYSETPYIQEIGIDLYSNPPVVYAPTAYDMMAYCTHPWISPHTYRTIFESALLEPPTRSSSAAAFEPNSGQSLLISGVVYPDGRVSRPEVVQLAQTGNGRPDMPLTRSTGGDHCLLVYNQAGERVARYCFSAGFLDAETGLPTESSPYFFTLPNVDLADIARIELLKENTPLLTITPSPNEPVVTVTAPAPGQVIRGQQTISWQASDADGDTLTYDLLYSPDGGRSWLPMAVRLNQTSYTVDTSVLPASQQALIRVIASDGFHTTAAQSVAPFVLEPGP